MSISVLIDQMETMLSAMDVGDPLRLFHGTYTRTTKAVASEIARGGFADNEWAERWTWPLRTSISTRSGYGRRGSVPRIHGKSH